MSIFGIWWLTGKVVEDPPDPYARIRTLEAERDQARADARVLAAEVNAVREAQRSCTCETCGKRGPAYISRLNTDASGSLDRNKP